MKTAIKKMLPDKLVDYIIRKKISIGTNQLYSFDKKRFIEYAYYLEDDFTAENLRSKITVRYHSIEKGLSNANLRLGFGDKAFKGLFTAMDKYIERGYSIEDIRFQSAISVIQAYVNLHKENNFSVEAVEEKLHQYKKYLIYENKDLGGYLKFNRKNFPVFSELNFEDLVSSRYSVRDFGVDRVREEKIYEAIQIATKTPSVCNRQAWEVYHIKNQNILNEALNLQGGLRGNGDNLKDLLLITSNIQYMHGPHERNQTYIDGGLFTMSLLYALHSKGIAACTLNVDFYLQRELDIRKLLGIQDSENLIAFIAVGTYPEEIKVAKSPRDSSGIITQIID